MTAIHFLYDAKFRTPVDKIFSELAAEEVCDIVEGDWVVNPQVQTAKNIRENVIGRLAKCADRLEAKQSAPRSKIVGEIESGKFGVSASSASYGKTLHTVAVVLRLRVTNKEKLETTVKRADMRMTANGETYSAHRQSLWSFEDRPDLLEKITDKTPIRQGVATTGSLEFLVEGLKRPDRGINADVTVTLIDEFDVPHRIRNKSLWISA